MPRVEVTSEPAPPPRASGKKVDLALRINYVDSKTGKTLKTTLTPNFKENERQIRQGLKY